MKKVLCILAAAALGSVQVKAQLQCGTEQVYQQLKKEHPEVAEMELRLGAAIKDAINAKAEAAKYSKVTAVTYDVPVVVHIIHDYGAENVNDNVIFDAVKYWDVVFNAENADTVDVIQPFKKYVGNPQIRLRMATIDPDGHPTKGITRRQSYLTVNGGDEAKMDYWPNDRYINVWFVNKFSADHSGAAAYAYYPSSAAYFPWYDGVIGISTYINYDKAIPHEFGHVLNLAHTWGSTNNPGVACGDDDVEDTPPTYGHTSCLAADLYDTRCAAGYTIGGTTHTVPAFYPDTVNTQNIMDYSYCQKMFTIGQSDRMRAALTSSVASRSNLFSSANLALTGALLPRPDLTAIADFSVDKGLKPAGTSTLERAYFMCQDNDVMFRFTNQSWNDTITGVQWAFSNGASTPTSTEASTYITNKFSDPGWVNVTLTALGNNTAASTVSRPAVYVASKTAQVAGYAQYFSSTSEMSNWPLFNYYNNQFKWEQFGTAGFPSADGCVRYRSYDDRPSPENKSGTPIGDYDDMISPAFDLTTYDASTGVLNLSFYTAGATITSAAGTDSLQIMASVNCGESWVRIASLKGNDLSNNGRVSGTEFVPTTSGQWKGQTVAIPASYKTARTFFKFRYWPGDKGNDLYFDNFAISPFSTDIADVQSNPNEVKLFPNPTTGDAKLCFTTGTDGDVSYVVRDLTGKVVYQHTAQYPSNTFVQENISRSVLAGSGVYMVTLTLSRQTVTQKLVVQ